MKHPSRQSLILMVRAPRDEGVKSRLAATLGSDFATDLYQRCAEHIVRETGQMHSPVERYVFYTSEEEDAVRRWLGRHFHFVAQATGSLGKRLEHAFNTVFSQGAQRIIIIATDVPELTHDILDEAMSAMDNADLVIGPSCDGGYYLLGMKSLHPQLFSDIPWSTERVYEYTMLRIKAAGCSCHVLTVLRDIDTEDDLRQWLASCACHDQWVNELTRNHQLVTEPVSTRHA